MKEWLRRQWARGVQSFHEDSLFRNAAYLMSSTAIMSLLGFGFWLFVAHLYTAAAIGSASALIAITLLISNLSFLGLNSGLVRFLPTSKNQSRDINAVLITVAAGAMAAAIAYLAWVGDDFASGLSVFSHSLGGQAAFVVLMAVVALNTLTDSVFIANRRAGYHTVVYAIFGIVKLVLPLFLIALGSLGIFTAYVAAALVSLVLSLVFMRRAAGYRAWVRPNWNFITQTRKYSRNNYVAALVSGLPGQLIPSLVVARLGAAHAAYFSMAWMMANLLYVVPSAITNSLLAESSHDLSHQSRNVRHAVRILAMILVPAVLLAVVLAPVVLRLFGPQYAEGGTAIFQLLAVSTFFVAGNSIGNTIMNLEHRTGGIVAVQAVIAGTTLALAWPLLSMGLTGLGLAVLGGTLAGNIVQLVLLAGGWAPAVNHEGAAPRRTTPPLPGRIPRAFLAQYGLEGASVGEDMGGGDRSGTMVLTRGSHKFVLKVYNSEKRTAGQIQAELDFAHYLLERGIRVPHVVANAAGEVVSQVTLDGTVWLGVLMDFEPGRPALAYTAPLLDAMARTQARIHLEGIAYAATHSHDQNIVRAGSLRSALLNSAPKGLSHFDFEGDNLLVEGDNIRCVLDFEGMRYDPVVVCLFFTLTRIYDRRHDLAELGLYVHAYQQVRPLNWMERRIVAAALMLHYRSVKLLALPV